MVPSNKPSYIHKVPAYVQLHIDWYVLGMYCWQPDPAIRDAGRADLRM